MIDRELQKELLIEMKEKYPHRFYTNTYVETKEQSIAFNLAYLEEHQLITDSFYGIAFVEKQSGVETVYTIQGKITAKGIDFLENDGGLSAILSTVTVRLHADTIRDLIDAKIIESEAIPDNEKSALRNALKGMKEEGLKQLTTRLISYGLDQGAVTAHQLTQWMSTYA